MQANKMNVEKLRIFQFDPIFYKALLVIAIPVVLQNLVGSMLNMVDSVMVGGLGEAPLAAVGIANQIFLYFCDCIIWDQCEPFHFHLPVLGAESVSGESDRRSGWG